MLKRRQIRKFLRLLLNMTFRIQEFLYCHRYLVSGIFLPWYIWSLLFYPEPVLWWLVTALSFIFVSISFLYPRSILYWIIPCIFLFNNIHIFQLPWPYIKMSYVGSLAVCFAAAFDTYNNCTNDKKPISFSTDFQFFFMAIFIATLLGVISQFIPNQLSSIEELKMQLRVIPFISQEDNFISMRFLWLWCCGLSLYWTMFKLIRNSKDIKILLWCVQWSTLPISIFGLYSYITRTYMVDFYIYERRICSTFSSPAVLADIFTVVLIIGIYLFRNSKSWLSKLTLAVLILFQFVTIILSGCRANVIILTLFGLTWFLIYTIKNIIRHNWKSLAVLLFIVSTLIISSIELPKINFVKHTPLVERISFWKSSISKKHNLSTTMLEGRKWHWECGMKMVRSSPLWGIGCGLFEQEYSRFKVENDMFNIARAHSVPLRILAEGGIITFVLFLIFLILTFIRFSRAFFHKANTFAPEYSLYLQMISVSFLAFFLLSLFSDIILVREECLFFLAVISACAARSYSKLPDFNMNEFLFFKGKLKKIERRMQRNFRMIGWEFLYKTPLSRLLKITAIGILFALFILGLSNAKSRRLIKSRAGRLSYGFYNKIPGNYPKRQWCSIGNHALTETKVHKDIFCFGYRAVNAKMATLGLKLKLYINSVPTAIFPLNSTEARWVYCDMTSLKDQYAKIEFKTDKSFIPMKEHWFADNYSYGAVITKPIWTNRNFKHPKKGKKATWVTKWKKIERNYR